MSREDDLLASAFGAVRETYDGGHDEADLTLQRALFKTRREARKRKVVRFSLLPIAAALVVSTAWAGATGRLGTAMQDLLRREPATEVAPSALAPVASVAVIAPLPSPVDAPPPAPEAPPVLAPAPPVLAAPAPPVLAPAPPVLAAPAPIGTASPRVTVPLAATAEPLAVVAPPAPSAPDPASALFAEAHRVHFREKDPARALAAWDAYLAAAPDGLLAPEAHYNRALALVRLGRKGDAMSELAGFANGSYRGYRQAEARALLDALAPRP